MKLKEKLHCSAATTRYSAERIFSDNTLNRLIIDFEGVEVITRSFADEMLYHLRNVEYSLINLNCEIEGMIEVVKRQRSEGRKRTESQEGSEYGTISVDEASAFFAM